MKKINTLSIAHARSLDVLSVSQMSIIRGGVNSTNTNPTITDANAVGPLSATLDDKRRDRPGGGVSTH